jgi:glycosyltransferase involved in cell wall biosynthesis
MRSDIVAVIPAYQCSPTIARVVAGARQHVTTVIVVDDGSSDGTGELARTAGAQVETLPRNRGKGFALRRGLEVALGLEPAAIVLLDGDAQHDTAEIPRLIDAWSKGQGDLVVGSRWGDAEAIPRVRYWTNYIGSRILSWMAGVELLDSQSGFRLLAGPLVRRLGLTADGYAIESEMLIKAARLGARISHAPVRAIYEGSASHFRPILDTTRICCSAIYYKVFQDG